MKLKLLPKFIFSLAILGVVLTLVISFFSYYNSKGSLEEMYANQVITGSTSIADMLSVDDVKTVIADGGDKTEAYEQMAKLLNTLKKDGNVTYLSLVVPDEDSVTFYIDSFVEEMGDDPASVIPYGSDISYTDAANDENDLQKYIAVWNLYKDNKGNTEPFITDNSYGYNYTSVTPILDESGNAVAEIQYILDMQSVRDSLNSFLYTILLISLAIIFVALVCYIFFVRHTVTKPIGKLAAFTNEITSSGEFENKSIELKTGDEIENLGTSFNYMLAELKNYMDNLAAITAEKERIGAELNVATQIQASMLPCIFPAFPERKEFDIYATMNPAKEVGGDFYDFFLVDEDHLAVVMADVSGKGVPAALFMVIAKTLIKDRAQAGLSPDEVFTKVNEQLCESNEEGLFVTAWLGVVEISTGHMVYANAGHNPPLVCKANGEYEYVKMRPGFVLAGMEGIKYKTGEIQFNSGDTLYLYTDGVTEATDANNNLYGDDRLKQTLDTNTMKAPKDILAAVKRDIDVFVGEAPQFDDITMLGLQFGKSGEIK